MYDNSWLPFANWAARQGIDPLGHTAAHIATFLYYLFDTYGLSPQSIKGYKSCLASVLSRTGNAKTISDMITSMELQRPRMTPILPQWDPGIVLEALSKPPYELLRDASLKVYTEGFRVPVLNTVLNRRARGCKSLNLYPIV